MSAPAANIAMSTPWNEDSSNRRSVRCSPLKGTVAPTDLSDAKAVTFATGNLRWTRILSICWPTSPVAPTTATFNRLEVGTRLSLVRLGQGWRTSLSSILRSPIRVHLVHGSHENRMYVPQLDEPVVLVRLEFGHLASRADERHDQ